MSSSSLARAASPPRPLMTLDDVALALLLALVATVQLDAIANRLSAALPTTLFTLLYMATVGVALLRLVSPPRQPLAGVAAPGARIAAMLFLWAIVAWTMSSYRDEGLDYLQKLAITLSLAATVLVIPQRTRAIEAIIAVMILSGAVSAAIVCLESVTGTRLVATSFAAITAEFDGVARSSGASDANPTTAAQMLMVSVALAAGMLVRTAHSLARLLLVAVIGLGLVALALMAARSALIGAAAAAVFVLLSFHRHRGFPLLVMATIVVAAIGLAFAPASLTKRFAAIGDFAQDRTLERRITYLRIGADLVAESPVWGIGPGNFPSYYVRPDYRYMPGRVLVQRELHNTYLDTAVEYGLVGFGLFAALIFAAGTALRRGWQPGGSPALGRASFAIASALAALLVASVFMPHKDLRYLWILIALAVQCGRLRIAEERAR